MTLSAGVASQAPHAAPAMTLVKYLASRTALRAYQGVGLEAVGTGSG
ncbi:hypothetical protein QEH68_20110 [Paenarthrobacter sp. OM7]|uniref:Uncharacterized protein n=1 Tax=Paenarthrobacter sp. AMU7 TaxID=3162492 RepID=A0AB39YN39_9MICC|nr:hypothetical protein [Paenarthrobacter sp. OM7]WGM20287.1 hypothetical protein QEH68_20110 [Paenarthrobacter sp. OM7]